MTRSVIAFPVIREHIAHIPPDTRDAMQAYIDIEDILFNKTRRHSRTLMVKVIRAVVIVTRTIWEKDHPVRQKLLRLRGRLEELIDEILATCVVLGSGLFLG